MTHRRYDQPAIRSLVMDRQLGRMEEILRDWDRLVANDEQAVREELKEIARRIMEVSD